MRVTVTLVIDRAGETRIEGNAPIFGNGADYKKGFDRHLRDIGFWLGNWRYVDLPGPNNKSKVFVPWPSCLMVETEQK